MMIFSRGSALAIGVLALGLAGGAGAQENLDSGKSGAQLFASDCAICHKTPQGLSKSGRAFGLDGFLREHYTASRESAAAIAAYIQATDKGPAAPAPGRAVKKGTGKGDDKTKGAEKKSGGKSSDTKTEDAKPADAKPAEAKPAESKPAESKPAKSKPAEAKPAESKPAESKPEEPKPAQSPKAD